MDENEEYIQALLARRQEIEKYEEGPRSLNTFFRQAHPWQRDTIKLTANHRVVGAIAGNRCGKTYTICGMIACIMTGIYPDWWEGRKWDRPVEVFLAGQSSEHNRLGPQKELFGTSNRMLIEEIGTGLIPRDNLIENGLIIEKKGTIQGASVRHVSGGVSTFQFKSYEQGKDGAAAQGFTADIVVVDEQPPPEFFSELVKRTASTEGLVLQAFTPLRGNNEMIEALTSLPKDEDYETNVKSGQCFTESELEDVKNSSRQRFAMVNTTMYDQPHLEPKVIEETLAMTPVYLRDAVARGIPVVGQGRVYPHALEDITIEHNQIPNNAKAEWLIGIDFGGTRDPAAAVLMFRDPNTDITYITEEWSDTLIEERDFAKKIWMLDPTVPVAWPRDGVRKTTQGAETFVSKLDEMGVNFLPKPFTNPPGPDGKANNKIYPGIVAINDGFSTGKLKISLNCVKLLKEVENYAYKDNGAPTGRDHLCDAFRYGYIMLLQDWGELQGNNKRNRWDNDDDYPDQNLSWGYG